MPTLCDLVQSMLAGPSWLVTSSEAAARARREAAGRANLSRSQFAEKRAGAWALQQRGKLLTANTVALGCGCAHGVAKRTLAALAQAGKATALDGGLYLIGKVKP